MRYILLFSCLLLSSLLNGQNSTQKSDLNERTENFPKQIIEAEKIPDKHNLWIFLLAGQSNMAGRGFVEPCDTLPDSRILTLTQNKQWILAKEPLHYYEPELTGLDCGLSFGREMIKHIPDSVSIALVPCAVGGSAIHQWLGDSVFKNNVDFAKKHGTVKGILWHQGESDATTDLIPTYEQNLRNLISEFRNIVGNKHLPFLMGELGSFRAPEFQRQSDSINEILHRVANGDENSKVIGTDDLESKKDNIHFNSEGLRSMGWRFARIFAGYYVNGRYTYKHETTGVICSIQKKLLIPSPNPQTATTDRIQYIGQGLKQHELRANISSSDWTDTHRERYSYDNGRSWLPWQLVFDKAPELNGFVQSGGPSQGGSGPLDPKSGMLIKPVFQRIIQGDPKEAMSAVWSGDRRFSDHGFYQLSADNGKSWDDGHLLKYEEGPDFDPDHWGNPEYFRTNEMYIGGICIHSGGNVVIAATIPVPYRDKEDEKIKVVFPNTYREGCVAGAMSFVGRWDPEKKAYGWQTSNRIFLPRKVSTRGLVEIDISELKDGRLLLIMRGSNVGLDSLECPGRKWISISSDGGLTWSEITDLRFDTGEQFYSPATFARTLRSRASGKLYCFLNISNQPPVGNGPRYPLQVAEIDEKKVCIIKETVTIIDDLIPGLDSTNLQLTNFGLLEDRENHQVELTLTRIGERGGGENIWDADTYRYVIKMK
ncbi:MAG: sialate O-acetylesterase [Bacteroidota bacterium]|nr:sialate O-acetylesterase [Bacteroidota bacterium]